MATIIAYSLLKSDTFTCNQACNLTKNYPPWAFRFSENQQNFSILMHEKDLQSEYAYISIHSSGEEHLRQPVFNIVCQASIALCLSILRRVWSMSGPGGIQQYVSTATHSAWADGMSALN